MEAMDQLLVACHAQTLNLFIESFLKMVQKLLESTDPQLQILATQSVSDDSWWNNINFVTTSRLLYLSCIISLSDSPILRRTHLLIIHGTTSLCQSILLCAILITTIPLYVNRSGLLGFRDYRYGICRMFI